MENDIDRKRYNAQLILDEERHKAIMSSFSTLIKSIVDNNDNDSNRLLHQLSAGVKSVGSSIDSVKGLISTSEIEKNQKNVLSLLKLIGDQTRLIEQSLTVLNTTISNKPVVKEFVIERDDWANLQKVKVIYN